MRFLLIIEQNKENIRNIAKQIEKNRVIIKITWIKLSNRSLYINELHCVHSFRFKSRCNQEAKRINIRYGKQT